MYNEFSKPTIEIDLYDNSVYINNIIELCNISEVKNILKSPRIKRWTG